MWLGGGGQTGVLANLTMPARSKEPTILAAGGVVPSYTYMEPTWQ